MCVSSVDPQFREPTCSFCLGPPARSSARVIKRDRSAHDSKQAAAYGRVTALRNRGTGAVSDCCTSPCLCQSSQIRIVLGRKFRAWRARCYLPGLLVSAAFLVVALCSVSDAASRPHPETIDAVPLLLTPQSQVNECRDLANQLHRAVPCPGLVPKPLAISSTTAEEVCAQAKDCGPAQVSVYRRSLLMTQMNFQVPSGYVGVSIETYNGWVPATSSNGGPLGHFVFETGTNLLGEYKRHSIKAASSIPSYCQPVSTVRIHGSGGTIYQCANSSNDRNAIETIAGHDMLQWVDHGMVTQVSFHGHSQVNLDLDLAIARSVVLVSPRR